MKSLIALWKVIAQELSDWCCTSTTLDYNKLERRCEHEGLSFLTITLPSFGKDFQKSLDEGCVGPTSFFGFQRKGGLPLFLGGFLDRVFDRGTGLLVDVPCVDSIYSIRQLTLMFEKINLPCSEERNRRAFQDYIDCESDVRRSDASLSFSDRDDFERIGKMLFSRVLTVADKYVYDLDLVPKHGPGSTADGFLGNQKYTMSYWHERLQRSFPSEEFLIPSPHFHEDLDDVEYREPGAEMPVKVITVPKTLKTPRIIAMEPVAMQYCQQAIMTMLVPLLERSNDSPGMLGFTDQVPNNVLARIGSVNCSLATVDLSEASDRVSNQHVRLLLKDHIWLANAVDDCRSRKADVFGHGVQRLAKFASMGSALTFPMEAMVFLTVVFHGIERELNRQLTRKDIKSLSGQVRVYGDDIIIPTDYVRSVIDSLHTFGYKVNTSKTFATGKFRESCGKDYYSGHDVTTTKVRHMFPSSRRDAAPVVSLVSLRNQLYERGLWQTARYLDGRIRKVLPHFPDVLPSSQALGRLTFLGFNSEKDHPTLHKPLVRAYVVSAPLPPNKVDGTAALMKCFLHKGNLPVADEKHLERSGRPQRVNIKLRWVDPT
jgi:hypothetical protein